MPDHTGDRTRRSQMQQVAKEVQSNPQIGEVKQVYEHIGNEDQSNFEADVQIGGGDSKPQKCPIETPGSDGIDIPEVGDKVILNFRQGGKKPYVTGVAYSNRNRPPVGTAGTFRRRFKSGKSPSGDGDLYFEANTNYFEKNAAEDDVSDAKTKQSVIRIAKRTNEIPDPTLEEAVPAKIEFRDEPYETNDNPKSEISVALNRVDDGGSPVKPDAVWGMKFDMKKGTFKLVDPNGFGIEAHGDGTFTWHLSDEEGALDFNEVSGGTGPLTLPEFKQ